jgi:hypothetical protein
MEKYIEEPIKSKVSGSAVRKSRNIEIDKMLHTHGDRRVLWRMAVEHKFGLMTTWALIMTALYLMPFLPELLVHL